MIKIRTAFFVLNCIFHWQHRNERRGLGGIFFDDLNDYDQEMLLGFSTGMVLNCQCFYMLVCICI